MAAPAGRKSGPAVQRLIRLMAMLADAGERGISGDRLIEGVGAYGNADPASQLGRDVRGLCSAGWAIENIADSGTKAVYRMSTVDNRIAVTFTPAQAEALARALSFTDRPNLAKRLGIAAIPEPDPMRTLAARQEASHWISLAVAAVDTRSRLRFDYKGVPRVVHPGQVYSRDGRWYLAATEEGSDSNQPKIFTIEAMSAVSLDEPGSAREVGRSRLVTNPLEWLVDEPSLVTIEMAAEYAPDVIAAMPNPQQRHDAGEVVRLDYRVTNRQGFRSLLYSLATRVRVVGPEEFRDEILAELDAFGGGH